MLEHPSGSIEPAVVGSGDLFGRAAGTIEATVDVYDTHAWRRSSLWSSGRG